MNIEDVTDQINWTNPNMFYQHYLIENYDPVDLPEIRIPGTFTYFFLNAYALKTCKYVHKNRLSRVNIKIN